MRPNFTPTGVVRENELVFLFYVQIPGSAAGGPVSLRDHGPGAQCPQSPSLHVQPSTRIYVKSLCWKGGRGGGQVGGAPPQVVIPGGKGGGPF